MAWIINILINIRTKVFVHPFLSTESRGNNVHHLAGVLNVTFEKFFETSSNFEREPNKSWKQHPKQILEATLHKTPAVRPLTSHLTNH